MSGGYPVFSETMARTMAAASSAGEGTVAGACWTGCARTGSAAGAAFTGCAAKACGPLEPLALGVAGGSLAGAFGGAGPISGDGATSVGRRCSTTASISAPTTFSLLSSVQNWNVFGPMGHTPSH